MRRWRCGLRRTGCLRSGAPGSSLGQPSPCRRARRFSSLRCHMKTIREIMRPSFLTLVQKTDSVSAAVRAMSEHNVGIVAVLDGSALVGVFSERDVVRRVVDRGLESARTAVEQVMTTDVVFGDINEDCQLAMLKM